MKIIDGHKIAAQIYESISLTPGSNKLAIIIASDNLASKKYVEIKRRRAAEIGVEVEIHNFEESSNHTDLVGLIEKLNNSEEVNGVMVQLPLFPHLEDFRVEILNTIDPKKDVDGLTSTNLGLLSAGNEKPYFLPATVAAIKETLEHIAKESSLSLAQLVKSKAVTIVNNSTLIGKPLAMYLTNLAATVTLCNEFTNDLKVHTNSADILIVATGKSDLIESKNVKENSILIDAGAPKPEIKRSAELAQKADWLTPVPGGIGPVTVACLLKNSIQSEKYYT